MAKSETALLIKATLEIYRDAALDAFTGIRRNWIVIPAIIVAYIVIKQAGILLAPLGMVGGFILSLVFIGILSLYYSWISETVEKNKLQARNLTDFNPGMFLNIVGVGFILFIAELVFKSVSVGADAAWMMACFSFAIAFLFNALPEVVIIHRYDGLNAFQNAFYFIRANWVEWYIPYLIVLAPWAIINPADLLLSFSQGNVLIPAISIVQGLSIAGLIYGLPAILAIVLGITIAHWYMLFRAYLFRELESGSRRRRMYLARQG